MNNFQDNVLNFRRGYLNDPGSNEPTFLTFSIDFNFISQLNEAIGLMSSPLFDIYTKNGAYQYLLARGYEYQSNCLLKFIKKLQEISETMPWFFQSISGLNTLWEAYTDMSKPYKGLDKNITIETLESVDLSITYLADMYRQAMYDSMYMRVLVPENLRRFQVDIYVAEFRNLVINQDTDGYKPDYSFFNNYKTHVHYLCSMCEFDFSKSIPFKDNITVFKPEMATNRFGIKPARFIEKNTYNLQDSKKIPTAIIGEVKQSIVPGQGNDKGRTALNIFEQDEYTKVSLNDMLYGSRRLSDVYHGIESGEYLNNFLKNNPVSAAITNVADQIENTVAYIKSNISPNQQQRESLNNDLPDDKIKVTKYSDIEKDRTVAYNKIENTLKPTTYADIKNSLSDVKNKEEKTEVSKTQINTDVQNPLSENTLDVTTIDEIDKTVKNQDNEKTFNNKPIDKKVYNPDIEKVFNNEPIDKTVKNQDNEKTFNNEPIDKKVYNPDIEKVFNNEPIDKKVYNPEPEKVFNNEPIDKKVYNPEPEKVFEKQTIDKTVYNKIEEKDIKADQYVKPTEALNPFEKSNDVI